MSTFRRSSWVVCSLVTGLWLSACSAFDPSAHAEEPGHAAVGKPPQPRLVSSTRTGRLTRFPCSDCHRMIDSAATSEGYRREHAALRFEHFAAINNCQLCHESNNMDALALLDGSHTSFDAAQELCGQCHGEKLRDFRSGAHGKVMGSFRDLKYRYVCTDCHDPHAPRRETVTARPAPPFPAFGIPKGAHP